MKPRKRKPSNDSFLEHDILGTIGKNPVVCSISVRDLAHEAGREKALRAAHFALTAIALMWQFPSQALNRMNLPLESPPNVLKELAFFQGARWFSNSRRSHMGTGLVITPSEWEQMKEEWSPELSVVDELIFYITSPDLRVQRPNMMSAIAHAFFWYYAGCREKNPLTSLVKFAAALDALSKGGRERGILGLIHARLGASANDTINRNGATYKQVVGRIYADGRSRLIHGNSDQFSHDWEDTRSLAEQLGRMCIISCLYWISENPDCDDPYQLSVSHENK